MRVNSPRKHEHLRAVSSRARSLALPLVAAGGAVALLLNVFGPTPALQAEDSDPIFPLPDIDMDGFSQLQEEMLGTDPNLGDSDADGYSDLEEIARGSNPNDRMSAPAPQMVSTRMIAHVENGLLVIGIATFVRASQLDGLSVKVGFMYDGVALEIPSNLYLPGSALTSQPGKDQGDIVFLVNTPYPEVLIKSLGALSFWTTMTPVGSSEPAVADVVNLFVEPFDGILMQLEFDEVGPGSVYRPIVPALQMAQTNWTADEICKQFSVVVGNVGPVVEHQIEGSGCDPQQGAWCSPSCSLLGGSTFSVVDPLALLGG